MRAKDQEFIKSLEPFDQSKESVLIFSIRLEKEWRRRVIEAVDYLSENEELLRLALDSELLSLDRILMWLEEREEYERCRVVSTLRSEISKEADLLVSVVARGDWTTSEL